MCAVMAAGGSPCFCSRWRFCGNTGSRERVPRVGLGDPSRLPVHPCAQWHVAVAAPMCGCIFYVMCTLACVRVFARAAWCVASCVAVMYMLVLLLFVEGPFVANPCVAIAVTCVHSPMLNQVMSYCVSLPLV